MNPLPLLITGVVWLLSPWAMPLSGRRLRAIAIAYPATLSLLCLAAHFYRNGFLLGVLICLPMQLLLFVPLNAATRVVQIFLLLGGLEWLRAAMSLIDERQASGDPWKRAAIILLSVEAFTILSAVLLQWLLRPREPAGFESVIVDQQQS